MLGRDVMHNLVSTGIAENTLYAVEAAREGYGNKK
jgi:hypothetical protein